jgi:2-methylfumaryl-CoA isomerase
MHAPLAGLRITEVSAFIAAPIGGLTLGQLGAEILRIDPLGGNIDYRRWPLSPEGTSLYWTALNKGKRSIALALNTPQGQELAAALITAPGPDAGILLTNLPASGWMSHAALSAKRQDLISLRLIGNQDGTGAVDYTVNCASGFAIATGQDTTPTNHVLPAWDVAAGLYLSTGLLAAERHRARTGQGQEISLALADVMLATVANLGYVADVQINNAVRPPLGNHLYGAFGRDFATSDNRRVMLVAISNRQWRALGKATGLADRLAMIGPLMDVDLNDEGGRFLARDAIAAVIAPWCAARTLAEIAAALENTGVLWGKFQDFGQLVHEDPRCSEANPIFATIHQAGVGPILAPTAPLHFSATPALPPHPAPTLGQDTEWALSTILGLPAHELAALHDAGTIRL